MGINLIKSSTVKLAANDISAGCNALLIPIAIDESLDRMTLDIRGRSGIATVACFVLVVLLYSALPAEIGELTSLCALNLSWCTQLGSLPAEIGQLTGLHALMYT